MKTSPKEPFPVERLREMFSYDPESGVVTWIGPHKFMRAGRAAGSVLKSIGYRTIKINRVRYLEHRICWALYYGTWPDGVLDHINTVKTGNRVANLRIASVSQNNRNRPMQSNNTTGFKGVTYHRRSMKFHAKIQANKVKYSLGYFETAQEAHEAYVNAAAKLHGEFHHG